MTDLALLSRAICLLAPGRSRLSLRMIAQTDVLCLRYTSTKARSLESPAHSTQAREVRRAPRAKRLNRFAGTLIALNVSISPLAFTTAAAADYGEVRAAARATG